MRSCIGENFLRRHPSLYSNNIEPHHGKTIGIDGKKVETIGKMDVQFRINGRHMRIPCRIVKNLVYDFVLGWDFFSKYKCVINPDGGYFSYENEKVEFIKSSLGISSTHFSLAEDTIVPPLSKMITQATVYINPADDITTTDYVEIEPIYGQIGKVAVGRSLSHIENGNFMVELLNPYTTPIAVKSDELLGHVCFTTDEEIEGETEETSVTLAYGGEDSGYESEGADGNFSDLDEDECPHPKPPPKTNASERPQPEPPPNDESENRKFKADLSTVPKDGQHLVEELRTVLEEKHGATFTTHERDRGRTDVVYHHAHMKPGPPISVPPYRATPQLQKEMDKQVHEMVADGLVSHSKSAFSAPVLMVKKKNGEWRLVTDFRKLNARCERVVYPLPRIEDALQKLKEPRFFSTMDLQKGFWQVPIAKEDRKYFAFSTGTMHVEYNVMPMGALNSSATMQALMSLILRGLPPEHIICFLDDILEASSFHHRWCNRIKM